MKYKKKKSSNLNLVIFIIIILILFIAVYLLYDNNYNITFTIDSEEVTIYQGEKINSSYQAYDNNGNPLEAKIDDKVDYNTPGEYQRCFTLEHGLYRKTLCQKVIVKENIAIRYDIRLNGDSTVYVIKGNSYNDNGAKVYNGNNEVFINLNTKGTVDTNNVGEYEIIYYFDINDLHKEVKRKIIVYDFNYVINKSTNNITSSNIFINVKVNSEHYSYTILPDNTKTTETDYHYLINVNGDYKFIFYDKYNNFKEEIINVSNIQRQYKCNGTIDRSGTTLTITSEGLDYINKYSYSLDNKKYDGKNKFNIYKIVNKASVTLTMKDNSSTTIDCSLTNKLTYKFKYDQNNTKEYISCNTYSAADRVKYDKILSEAIKEVGIFLF